MEQIILSINWTRAIAVVVIIVLVIALAIYGYFQLQEEKVEPNGTISDDIEEARKKHERNVETRGMEVGPKSDYVSSTTTETPSNPLTNESQATDSSTLALLLKQGKAQTIDDLVEIRGMNRAEATMMVLACIESNNLKWGGVKLKHYIYK